MGIVPYTVRSDGANGLCTTPACINIADDILGSMALDHERIDPCTDFDELVCGNWPTRNPIPAGQASLTSLAAVSFKVLNYVRNILEDPYPTDKEAGWITVSLTKDQAAIDKENFAKLQGAYQVCMNSTAKEEEGLVQLQSFAQAVVESFPATANSDHSRNNTYDHSASMGRTLALFESFGIETTQRLLQKQYSYDPSKMVLLLAPPQQPENPSDPDDVPEYLRLSSGLLSAVHPANLTESESYDLMKSVLAFQIAITPEESDIPDSNSTNELGETFTSSSQLQIVAPQLNYNYVIDQLAPEGIENLKIVTGDLEYWRRLSLILSGISPEVLQAFFVWKSITALSEYVDSPVTDAYKRFEAKQRGEDAGNPAPQWFNCARFLDTGVAWTAGVELVRPTGLTWILSRFFADKNFTPEAKSFTSQIIDNLEAAFISRIRTREWATAEVKQAAIDKVHAMAIKIGLPSSPLVTDPQSLKEYYSDVNITTSHLINALSLARSQVAKNWEALDKPFDKDQFLTSTLEANAFHIKQENSMTILAGIQQSPLYGTGYPAYITYGGMGSIVGHEITHGFDADGHKYDKTGNFSSWFDSTSTKGFESAAECFIKQYSNFTVTDPDGETNNVDGKLTLNENVADAGGVLASYSAWKRYEAEQGRALDLPGLTKYTHEQLFFIKFGQNWCENLGATGKTDLTDEHAPNKARILLPLKNSAEFQRAFGCPQKKPSCELW